MENNHLKIAEYAYRFTAMLEVLKQANRIGSYKVSSYVYSSRGLTSLAVYAEDMEGHRIDNISYDEHNAEESDTFDSIEPALEELKDKFSQLRDNIEELRDAIEDIEDKF